MNAFLRLVEPFAYTGAIGCAVLLLTMADAVFEVSQGQNMQRITRAIRLGFRTILLCSYLLLVWVPWRGLVAVQRIEPDPARWNSMAYSAGVLGRVDTVLRIWIGVVLTCICVWFSILAITAATRVVLQLLRSRSFSFAFADLLMFVSMAGFALVVRSIQVAVWVLPN